MASRQRTANAIIAAFVSASLLLPGAGASAQDAGSYPNRPVTMIVPFAPGGASDFVARTINLQP
jgi:tripartite-type tricarboxylate transporter receptor subunit TctC